MIVHLDALYGIVFQCFAKLCNLIFRYRDIEQKCIKWA